MMIMMVFLMIWMMTTTETAFQVNEDTYGIHEASVMLDEDEDDDDEDEDDDGDDGLDGDDEL